MNSGSTTPVVRAQGLARRYNDGRRIVEVFSGLDFTVSAGESVSVIGDSGVGKSTLLHLLGGLDRPDDGQVFLQGHDVAAMKDADLARLRNAAVGFVFQFHHLLGDFTAEENVMLPLMIGGETRPQARARAAETLERMGLADRLTHRPGEMSGGEQQRVAVARALVGRPAVIMADEPTGNLDPDTAEAVHGLLVDVQKEAGCALVIVTHSAALAALGDRTLRMEREGIVEIKS
ncbi:MAG: lipoprotein-releasing system ATP-binding protein [Hyphomicrobiaceae bacterium]|jgi:lipoprotein-releasing system ATP-binding protein